MDANLRAGWNKVLVRVENRSAGWEFFFRIADDQLLPFSDLKWATQPAALAPANQP